MKTDIGKKIFDISLDKDFFGYYTKNTSNKSKNQQLGLHKTKLLCTAKKQNNQQPMEYKKIFMNLYLDKGLISKIR